MLFLSPLIYLSALYRVLTPDPFQPPSKNLLTVVQGPGGQGDHKTQSQLLFSLLLNRPLYTQTRYANPPQIAIWLEDANGDEIRTVYVTEKSARGNWDGKTVCPTCLPYYMQRKRHEFTESPELPTKAAPLPDAVTAATPADTLIWNFHTEGSRFQYFFIEINVSGDYNECYKNQRQDPGGDDGGNGQPSLVYRGVMPFRDQPIQLEITLMGVTNQYGDGGDLNQTLEGISTAKDLIVEVSVQWISDN